MDWKWVLEKPGAAVGAFIAAWLTGFLNQFVPCPARSLLAVQNLLRVRRTSSTDRFRFVLCWLVEDRDGKNNRTVVRAFRDVGGVELVRSARLVGAGGALDDWKASVQESALAVLEDWDGDVAIVGEVKRSEDVLSLWFVPASGKGTLEQGDRFYKLQASTLGGDFQEDVRAQLAVVGLTAVSPRAYTKERRGALEDGLRVGTNKLARILDRGAIEHPEHRAALQRALGNAYRILGKHGDDTDYLKKAVWAFRAALADTTREQRAIDWADIQGELGDVLQALGRRTGDSAYFAEAVTARRAALEEYTRDALRPASLLLWSIRQTSLGDALKSLGETQGDVAVLDEAEEALQAVLDEELGESATYQRIFAGYHLGHVLLARGRLTGRKGDFARAVEIHRTAAVEAESGNTAVRRDSQARLGRTLIELWRRDDDTVQLEQAVDALEGAVRSDTPEDRDYKWAATQRDLGDALVALGRRKSGSDEFEKAVKAYRAALDTYPREEMPGLWALVQVQVGNVLLELGTRGGDVGSLNAALAAYELALEEKEREHVPLLWCTAHTNLGATFQSLWKLQNDPEHLRNAVRAFAAALEEDVRSKATRDWAMIQNWFGNALHTLGRLEEDGDLVERAVDAYRSLLEIRTREQSRVGWAETQHNLGDALLSLGQLTDKKEVLVQALDAYCAALEVRSRADLPLGWAQTQCNVATTLLALGTREGDTQRFREALEVVRLALEEGTRERAPVMWATMQYVLGQVLMALAEEEKNLAMVEQAVEAFREALKERDGGGSLDWDCVEGVDLYIALRKLEGEMPL